MITDSWNATNADWNAAADWSGGVPSASTTASIAGTSSYVVTLFGAGQAATLQMSDAAAQLYIAGTLAVAGTITLQAGTLALSGGILSGGTLALLGGQFLSTGGTLSAVTVDGTLNLATAQESLFVTGGMHLFGAAGTGTGSIALIGGYAALDFGGTQSLNNAVISIGASGAQPGQAGAATLGIIQAPGSTAGATLTLGSGLWLRGAAGQGVVQVGGSGPATAPGGGPAASDALVNQGTITAGVAGELLTIAGGGSFTNQGTIGISNAATLQIATAAFSNTGTIVVNSATLSLGGTWSTALLSNLGAVSLTNSQIQLAGTAQNTGTLALGAGSHLGGTLGTLSLAGTIVGGTIADGGGGVSFAPGTGVLDGVTYAGTLDLATPGTLTLTDSASVTGTSGSTGTILDTGAGSNLLLRGTETLTNVQISLGSAGAAASIATGDLWLASTATTATLGAGAAIIQTGANAALNALGWSGVPGFGAADTLVNAGTITAGVAGGQFVLGGYGTILNQGGITVSGGDTLRATVQQFVNTGTLTASTGGTIQLGQPASWYGTPPSWSNSGLIVVSGGTLSLGGATTTAQLGQINETSGTVLFGGTLNNANATLTLGTTGATLKSVSLSGTIAGGTIIDPTGLLAIGASTGALLDGVTYRGTLTLGAGQFLRVQDGLSLTGTAGTTTLGTANLLGAGSVLDFTGSQTFDHARVLLGATGQAATIGIADTAQSPGGTTLTLGSGLTVVQSGALATLGNTAGAAQGQPADMIVNQGTITAGTAGGTLTLGGSGFTNAGFITVGQNATLAITAASFSNTGSIAVAGGTLSLAGSLTLPQLGQLGLSAGLLSVQGTLNLAGGTLSIGQGTPIGRMQLTGTIAGGIIADSGAGLAVSGNATLIGVTYAGTLDLSRPFAQLTTLGGLTIAPQPGGKPGIIALTGAQSRLTVAGSETLANTQILLGSFAQLYLGQHLAAPELAIGAGVQLILGPSTTVTLNGTSGLLGDTGTGQWTDSVINQGQIAASTNAGTLAIGTSFFTNAATGTITTGGGAIVALAGVGILNAGTIDVGAGSAVQVALLNYYAAPDAGATLMTNTGTIAMQGGILQELTANGLFPAIPLVNQAGGIIRGNGLLFAQVNNYGLIDAQGGVLQLTQAVSGPGLLAIEPGATLELAVPILASQTVDFSSAGGTLKLDTPATFAGTLQNFAAGDVIDLPGQILTGVGLSSGTLVLSTATLNYRLVGSTPFAGEVSAGHDVHGGATIMLTPQMVGSGAGPALIAVGQPNMLFWASPAGDVFSGTSINLMGAHISNWGAADSIDITDLLETSAHLTITETATTTTLSLSDGTHATSIGLTGTYAASSFHLTADASGGTLLTFGH